ncbi:MAG: MFS transporter [Thermoplasmata archaeon]
MKGSISFSTILTILLILIVTFTMRMTTNMLMTSIPVLSKFTILASTFLTAVPVSMYSVTGMLANLFINGRIKSRNIGITIAISLVGLALMLPLYYFSSSIWDVIAISAVGGLFMGLVPPLLLTLISLSYDEIRDHVLGLYTSVLSLSLIAGTFFQAYVLSDIKVPIRSLFIYFFPVALLAGIVMFVLSARLKIKESESRKKVSTVEIVRTIPVLFKNRGFSFGFFGNLTYSFPFIIILTYGSLLAYRYSSMPPDLFFYALTAFFFTSMITRFIIAFRPPKNRFRLMIISLLATILGFSFLIFSNNIIYFVLSMVFLGFPHGSIYPIATMSVSSSVPRDQISIAYATFNIIFNIIGLSLPPVFGAIAELTNLRTAMLFMVIPMGLIAYESIKNGGNLNLKSYVSRAKT